MTFQNKLEYWSHFDIINSEIQTKLWGHSRARIVKKSICDSFLKFRVFFFFGLFFFQIMWSRRFTKREIFSISAYTHNSNGFGSIGHHILSQIRRDKRIMTRGNGINPHSNRPPSKMATNDTFNVMTHHPIPSRLDSMATWLAHSFSEWFGRPNSMESDFV